MTICLVLHAFQHNEDALCTYVSTILQDEKMAEAKAAEAVAERNAHITQQEQAIAAAARQQEETLINDLAMTLREQMMHEVMPSVSSVLLELVRVRPPDPIGFLSQRLLAHADLQDSEHTDPYDAPIYGQRRELVAGKLQREEERARAWALKADREAVAKAEADKQLRTMLIQSVQKHESMMRT
jgi:ribosomal protein L25 (general stress protein Ctc)